MKNKILSIILIILFWGLILWYFYINKEDIKNRWWKDNDLQEKTIIELDIKTKKEIEKENKKKQEEEKEKQRVLNKQEKLEKSKKELEAKWLVLNWDLYLKNNEYLFALQKFLKANKETPDDPKILAKIADSYFLMKNYKFAYKYYCKIDNEEYLDKNNKVLSFIYSKEIEKYNFTRNSRGLLTESSLLFLDNIKKEIKTFNFNNEDLFYYLNSIECIKEFDICNINFNNYLKNENFTWTNKNLKNIYDSIDSYKNFKLPKEDLAFKNALLVGAFMKNKNYPLTIILAKKILNDKKKYKSMIKILAQSYFELNNLDKANKYLIDFTKIDRDDSDVSYMIWIIAQKKHNYVKSNIFLRLAIEQGHGDLENNYRLQLYNYLILWENNKISAIFDKILEADNKPYFDDLILAIYYNITNGNIEKADTIANMWLRLYPKKEDFYWFKAWILIEKGNLEQSLELLNRAKKINPKNALIILNIWRISKIKYERDKKVFDKRKAIFLFKKTIDIDSSEIGILAKKYLKEIEEFDKIEEKNKEMKKDI